MCNETSALEVLTISFCALHAGGFLSPFCMYVGISLLYASVAGALVSFVEPLAAGSGIAEVKTYLNGIHIRGLLAVGAPLTTCCGCIHKTCSLILLAASTGGKESCRLARRPIQERMPGDLTSAVLPRHTLCSGLPAILDLCRGLATFSAHA